MSLDSITSALENFDLGAILPDLLGFFSSLQTLCVLAMMIGPVVMLALGIWYLFFPRRDVGHRGGFQAYFALGSEAAWLFTQKMAGLVWTGLGGILTLVMGIMCLNLSGELNEVTQLAHTCLIWQVVLAALSWIALKVLPAVFYNRDGQRRRK